jgi:hypothetical protein
MCGAGLDLTHPISAQCVFDYCGHLARLVQWLSLTHSSNTYFLCFLNRVNICNTRLYRLEDDLGLHGDQYQTAVSVLFATYVAAESPSNLLLKRFTPPRWLAVITTIWGIISTLAGVVQSYGGLIACRLLLDLIEGGHSPGRLFT